LAIAIGCIIAYGWSLKQGGDEAHTRNYFFTVLITANIFLPLVNRSFYYSILTTLKYKNKLVSIIISTTLILTALLIYIPLFRRFFEFEAFNFSELGISFALGFFAVIWFELVKWPHRKQKPNNF